MDGRRFRSRKGAGDIEASEVGPLLASLLDRCLVARDDGGRYTMLESVREYAQDLLAEGHELDPMARRHCAWVLELAEEAEPHLVGAEQAAWLNRLEQEHDNLRAALMYRSGFRAPTFEEQEPHDPSHEDDLGTATLSGEAGSELRIVAAVWRFWQIRGYLHEGRRHILAALERAGAGADPAVVCRAMNAAGGLAWEQGDLSEAGVLYEQALAISRRLGNRMQEAGLLNNLGLVAHRRGDYGQARAFFEVAMAINRETKHRRGVAANLNNLGTIAKEQGDYGAAQALFRQALAVNRTTGNRAWAASNLANLGLLAQLQGDHAEARSLTVQALSINHEIGNRAEIAQCLETLAALSARRTPGRAARLWGAADRIRDEAGVPVPQVEREAYDREVATARAGMSGSEFSAAWSEGCCMSLDEAVAFGIYA